MNDNKNTKSTKKFFSIQWSALWCFIGVATLLAMIGVSVRIVVPNWKIFHTQLKMIQCYTKIDNLESIREENLYQANNYVGGATSYVAAAERADEQITIWNDIRSSYVHNDDPIVAMAAKDGFEFKLFSLSLLSLLLVVGVWVATFRWEWFYTKVLILFRLEFLLVCAIMSGLFYLLDFAFKRLCNFFAVEHNYFKRYHKKVSNDLKKEFSSHKKVANDEKICPFEPKSRKRRRKIG